MNIIENILAFISIQYILSVNIASYAFILVLSSMFKNKLKTYIKRIITVVIGIGMWYVYHEYGMITAQVAIPSFFLSIIIYDYLIKEILSKFNLLIRKPNA